MTKLTTQQIADAELTDWVKLESALHARFETGDFATGAAFVQAITEVAEAADHHPDVMLTYPRVDLRLISHDVDALTERDVSLARRISDLARERGISSSPRAVQQVEVALDTADRARLSPFWASVLTADADNAGDIDVVDPTGQSPNLWFQATEPHETPKQRYHFDVWIDPETLPDRIAAAVAAGGTVVDARKSPSYVVLADADGNRVCFCTNLNRD